jgi:hypothetical protein
MKYRLKYAIPFIGCADSTVETDSQGFIRLEHDKYYNFQPKYYEDLFEPIKPKRVLVVEYEIVSDEIGFNAGVGALVSEIGASRYLTNYPNNCRIEERY